MALLDRFRKQSALPVQKDEAKTKKMPAKTPAKEKAADAETQAVAVSPRHLLAYRLLRKPQVSEKAAHLTDRGTYVFQVPTDAEKIAIKKAVEAMYKVNVSAVRTMNYAGKTTQRGRRPGARKNWKKALVTLKSGQKIDLYEGV
jgi:large subunit ribosomal protein L23